MVSPRWKHSQPKNLSPLAWLSAAASVSFVFYNTSSDFSNSFFRKVVALEKLINLASRITQFGVVLWEIRPLLVTAAAVVVFRTSFCLWCFEDLTLIFPFLFLNKNFRYLCVDEFRLKRHSIWSRILGDMLFWNQSLLLATSCCWYLNLLLLRPCCCWSFLWVPNSDLISEVEPLLR